MQAQEIALLNPEDRPTASPAPLSPDASLAHVLQALTESREEYVTVAESDSTIDTRKAVAALATLIPDVPDSSVIELSCLPGQYTASGIARAIEDADANLITLMSYQTPDDMINVSLRIDHADPSAAVHSLERYGYSIRQAYGSSYSDVTLTQERISALQRYLNI